MAVTLVEEQDQQQTEIDACFARDHYEDELGIMRARLRRMEQM